MTKKIKERIQELEAGLSLYFKQANRDREKILEMGEIKTWEDLECYEVHISRMEVTVKRVRSIDAALFELKCLVE